MNTPLRTPIFILTPQPPQRTRSRGRGRYRNVQLPRRGLLFHGRTTTERKMEEFFPRLFRVNPSLSQTLLYGHIDLKQDNKCFVEMLGWNYLEFCEEVRINNVEIDSFPFQHFHWWFKIVKPYVVDRHCYCCGR